MTGTAGTDIVVGTAGANQLVGGAGDDLIFGAGGDDMIRWNPGDGRDFVDGGAGNDRFWLASPDGVVVYETIAAARLAFPTETFRTDTEKVVARNGVVIAELKNVEQVVYNTPPSLQLNGFDPVRTPRATTSTRPPSPTTTPARRTPSAARGLRRTIQAAPRAAASASRAGLAGPWRSSPGQRRQRFGYTHSRSRWCQLGHGDVLRRRHRRHLYPSDW